MRGHFRSRRRAAGGLLLLTAVAISASAAPVAGSGRPQDPVARIELDPIGYQVLQAEPLAAGSPMLTLDYIDQNHLLVTFEVRRLMEREKDAPPNEHDRIVRACLLEVATGKLLAQTEWRLHDRSRYLWNLGQGRFLLRIHDELLAFAPLKDAFHTVAFMDSGRRILDVLLSPDRDLMTVLSVKPREPETGPSATGTPREQTPVQYNFYRLRSEGGAEDVLRPVPAGIIRTSAAVALPITTAGYLDVIQSSKNTWVFDFDEHSGKVRELPALDTSCFPRPVFVDRSEFVAFGCKGGEERRMLAGFNLHGEEMWQQGFYESYVAPTFSFAPAAGRFALGRTIVPLGVGENDHVIGDMVREQEVRVYQTYNGTQLFHIDCSPAERAGQNFALSPDGLHLAVVREAEVKHKATKGSEAFSGKATGIEIYALPALTSQDESAVKAEALTAPPDRDEAIDVSLARIAAGKAAEQGKSKPSAPVQPPENAFQPKTNANAATEVQKSGAAAAVSPAVSQDGEEQPAAEPRSAPTLRRPGETDDAQPSK